MKKIVQAFLEILENNPHFEVSRMGREISIKTTKKVHFTVNFIEKIAVSRLRSILEEKATDYFSPRDGEGIQAEGYYTVDTLAQEIEANTLNHKEDAFVIAQGLFNTKEQLKGELVKALDEAKEKFRGVKGVMEKSPAVGVFSASDDTRLRNVINFGGHIDGEKNGLAIHITVTNPSNPDGLIPINKLYFGEYVIEQTLEDGSIRVLESHKLSARELAEDWRRANSPASLLNGIVGKAMSKVVAKAAQDYLTQLANIKKMEAGLAQVRRDSIEAAYYLLDIRHRYPQASIGLEIEDNHKFEHDKMRKKIDTIKKQAGL